MATKIPAQTLIPWLRENLGRESLAPLAGKDHQALIAAVSLIDLMEWHDTHQDIHLAYLACVQRMQQHTRHLAYHAIAHVLDWPDRARIWENCGLTPPTSRCKYEPASRTP